MAQTLAAAPNAVFVVNGNEYFADASGIVRNVADVDVASAIAMGCRPVASGFTPIQPVFVAPPVVVPPAVGATALALLLTASGLASPMATGANPAFSNQAAANAQVLVDARAKYQTFLGVGAAITDSAVYNLTTYMTKAQRTALFQEAFGTNGLSTVRVCMGSADFRRDANFYTYADNGGVADPSLTSFSVQKDIDAGIIGILLEILAINPNLKVFACPWSPPAWMKSGGSPTLLGGSMNETAQNFTSYAQYFVKFVQAYAALGVPVHYVSVQNEPAISIAYPSCTWTGAGLNTFTKTYLAPALSAAGLSTKILAGEDNWDRVSPYLVPSLSDATTLGLIAGAAFHGYGGDGSYQSNYLDPYPTKERHDTEYRTLLAASLDAAQADMAANWMIGSLRNGASSVTMWNFALDPSGNPTQQSSGRRGVVLVNTDGSITRSPDYYVLAHIGRLVRRGATRIASTTYASGSSGTDVESVAFLNPDGGVVVFLWNGAASDKTVSVVDAASGQVANVTIPTRAMATMSYPSLGAAAGASALAVDATATGNSGGNASSMTWSHTVDPKANLLIVALGLGVPSASGVDYPSATSVTAGGLRMTKLDQALATGNITGGLDRAAEIWYLKNPPAGALSIVANTPQGAGSSLPSSAAASISFLNSLGGSPLGAVAKTATSTSGGASSLTASPATASPGITVGVGAARSTSTLAVGAGETAIAALLSGTNTAVTAFREANGNPATASVSWTTADQGALLAVPVLSAA